MLPDGYSIGRYGAWDLTLYGRDDIALVRAHGTSSESRTLLISFAQGHATAFDDVQKLTPTSEREGVTSQLSRKAASPSRAGRMLAQNTALTTKGEADG